ncbi:MAG: YitT family protein, partial [Firmicutes bacterium]|nr:YitT family protein [Bacillota bacterium]
SGIFIYDFRLVGYTLISMFVTGMVIDRVQLGLNRGMWVMIVSQSADQIQEAIIHRLRRGVTILHGEGGYTHNALKIVITTVSRTQLAKLKDIVAEIDEKAFVTVHETAEVLGRGFPRQLEKTQTAQRS